MASEWRIVPQASADDAFDGEGAGTRPVWRLSTAVSTNRLRR